MEIHYINYEIEPSGAFILCSDGAMEYPEIRKYLLIC